MDCECVSEASEWKAVREPPSEAPRLSVMIRLIAGLGGCIASSRSEPGVQPMWIGPRRMYDLA